jgi:DNA helicase-2/ATP-dependent DNA helicase PcrA
MPNSVSTVQHSPQASSFRVRDRVFHNKFGHGIVVATDGPKLTIEFDDGGVKRVLDGFVVKSNSAPRSD